jgi:hypothetical protein
LLLKEARSRQSIANADDVVFITTTLEVEGFHAPIRLFTPPSIVSLMGAIVLSDAKNLLAFSRF